MLALCKLCAKRISSTEILKMQRQFAFKLTTKISKSDPFRQQFSSRYFAVPRNFGGSNEVSGRIRNGFFQNPALLSSRFFSNAIVNRGRKSSADGSLWAQARRHFYSFNNQYGRRSFFGGFTTEGVVIGLIAANAAVYILWNAASPRFMISNFTVSVQNFTSGRIHTLLTSAFSHRDMWHLIYNMLGLYFFGMSIGHSFGPEYLLRLYISGALVGSIFYLVHHAFIAPSFQRNQTFGVDYSRVPGLGASGAVNAIMLLDIFLFPTKTLYFDFFIPVPAILLGIFIVGKDILRIVQGDSQVSGSAHLGGATVAALAWAYSRRGHFRRF